MQQLIEWRSAAIHSENYLYEVYELPKSQPCRHEPAGLFRERRF
jgi:hypothetical protein